MTNILIKTKDIDFKALLKYPDFEIPLGGMTFIVGPSGTGKTTLLKLLNTTETPSKGHIYIREEALEDKNPLEIRRTLLLCGQTVYLFDESIRDNFKTYYQYRDLTPPDDSTIEKYLTLCAAPFKLDMQCSNLSGGERQRVYLAIFLSFNSPVLMLDEPTSALDSQTSQKLFDNLKTYSRDHEKTFIIVSHDTSLVESYADHLIEIKPEYRIERQEVQK